MIIEFVDRTVSGEKPEVLTHRLDAMELISTGTLDFTGKVNIFNESGQEIYYLIPSTILDGVVKCM